MCVHHLIVCIHYFHTAVLHSVHLRATTYRIIWSIYLFYSASGEYMWICGFSWNAYGFSCVIQPQTDHLHFHAAQQCCNIPPYNIYAVFDIWFTHGMTDWLSAVRWWCVMCWAFCNMHFVHIWIIVTKYVWELCVGKRNASIIYWATQHRRRGVFSGRFGWDWVLCSERIGSWLVGLAHGIASYCIHFRDCTWCNCEIYAICAIYILLYFLISYMICLSGLSANIL